MRDALGPGDREWWEAAFRPLLDFCAALPGQPTPFADAWQQVLDAEQLRPPAS